MKGTSSNILTPPYNTDRTKNRAWSNKGCQSVFVIILHCPDQTRHGDSLLSVWKLTTDHWPQRRISPDCCCGQRSISRTTFPAASIEFNRYQCEFSPLPWLQGNPYREKRSDSDASFCGDKGLARILKRAQTRVNTRVHVCEHTCSRV